MKICSAIWQIAPHLQRSGNVTQYWYALRVKPHKERSVVEYLQAREVELFAPTVRVKPKNPRAAKKRPYFPGYLFVHADLKEEGQQAFNWIPGTHGLVAFDDEPAIVPAHLIHELQQRIAQLNARGGVETVDFKKGQRVRIVSGPFEGYEAIFDMRLSGKERVQVLLRFLSDHPQPVQLSMTDIENSKK
jgi:transcription elongation factor/antiterminator RfaH